MPPRPNRLISSYLPMRLGDACIRSLPSPTRLCGLPWPMARLRLPGYADRFCLSSTLCCDQASRVFRAYSIACFASATHRQNAVFLVACARAAADWTKGIGQALLLYLAGAFLSTGACAAELCWGLEAVLLPDHLALRGAHEINKLLGEARIVGLAGKCGQHVKGWIELGRNGKLAQRAGVLALRVEEVGVVDNGKVAWRWRCHQRLRGSGAVGVVLIEIAIDARRVIWPESGVEDHAFKRGLNLRAQAILRRDAQIAQPWPGEVLECMYLAWIAGWQDHAERIGCQWRARAARKAEVARVNERLFVIHDKQVGIGQGIGGVGVDLVTGEIERIGDGEMARFEEGRGERGQDLLQRRRGEDNQPALLDDVVSAAVACGAAWPPARAAVAAAGRQRQDGHKHAEKLKPSPGGWAGCVNASAHINRLLLGDVLNITCGGRVLVGRHHIRRLGLNIHAPIDEERAARLFAYQSHVKHHANHQQPQDEQYDMGDDAARAPLQA